MKQGHLFKPTMAAEEAPTAVVDDVPEEGESDGDSGFGSDM